MLRAGLGAALGFGFGVFVLGAAAYAVTLLLGGQGVSY